MPDPTRLPTPLPVASHVSFPRCLFRRVPFSAGYPFPLGKPLRFAGFPGLSSFPELANLRRVLDDVVSRVDHRHGPASGLAGLAGNPQQLAGLDVGAAVPGTESDADLAAVVAQDDRPNCASAFGDVLDFVDPSFEGSAMSRDQGRHSNHRGRPLGVFVGFDVTVLALGNPRLYLVEFAHDPLLEAFGVCLLDP